MADHARWRAASTENLVDEACSYLYGPMPAAPPYDVAHELVRRLAWAEGRLAELGVSVDEWAAMPTITLGRPATSAAVADALDDDSVERAVESIEDEPGRTGP